MNAPKNGVYIIGGNRFLIREGDPLPDGAVFDDPDAPKPEPEPRARPKAPENKARAGDAKEQR